MIHKKKKEKKSLPEEISNSKTLHTKQDTEELLYQRWVYDLKGGFSRSNAQDTQDLKYQNKTYEQQHTEDLEDQQKAHAQYTKKTRIPTSDLLARHTKNLKYQQ